MLKPPLRFFLIYSNRWKKANYQAKPMSSWTEWCGGNPIELLMGGGKEYSKPDEAAGTPA